MKSPRLFRKILAAALLVGAGAATSAEASSLWLNSLTPNVSVGDQAVFELWMDFTGDPTLGGGVDVVFDNFTDGNQLAFAAYTAEPLGDTDLISTPSVAAMGDRVEGITFGDLATGLEGPALVGTLQFNANAAGNYNLSLVAAAGGFFSITGPEQFPTFTGDSVNVEAVPLPATGWLMLSALWGFFGFRTRSNIRG
ncbi:hypothetical protein [Methylomagnum sp.]